MGQAVQFSIFLADCTGAAIIRVYFACSGQNILGSFVLALSLIFRVALRVYILQRYFFDMFDLWGGKCFHFQWIVQTSSLQLSCHRKR